MRVSRKLATHGVALSLRQFLEPLSCLPRRLATHDAHCVVTSNAHDVFENLSTEEALLRGLLLEKGKVLLFLYVNAPCVVVGRNQNVVEEVALRRAGREGVAVARRSSGGGAVYHDMGNLCFSFFTHRADYAPEKTIQFVRLGLCAQYGIDPARLTSSHRYDLYLDGKKITGSAMRVQRDVAFHHCTLLIDSDRQRLGEFLRAEADLVACTSPAVGSVRSAVTTLACEGVLPVVSPDEGDAEGPTRVHARVRSLQEAMSRFFLENADTIMRHPSPWDLDPRVLGGTPPPGLRDDSLVTLDVRQAATPGPTSYSMLYAEGRTPPASESATLVEEIQRMKTRDWLFAMPQYSTHTQLTRDELARWLRRHPRFDALVETCGLSAADVIDEVLAALFGTYTAVHFRARIDHRVVRQFTCALGPQVVREGSQSTPTVDETWSQTLVPLLWLDAFFEAMIVGELADGPLCLSANSPAVSGFRVEAGDAFVGELDLPDAALDICCEILLTQLLACWRHKNVLDA